MSYTPAPWLVATSNSWRRIVSRDHGNVCEPITQSDGHPDLHFRNGGQDGPDARLLVAAPDLLAALIEVRRLINLPGGQGKCYAHATDVIDAALSKATVLREAGRA